MRYLPLAAVQLLLAQSGHKATLHCVSHQGIRGGFAQELGNVSAKGARYESAKGAQHESAKGAQYESAKGAQYESAKARNMKAPKARDMKAPKARDMKARGK